MTQKIEKPWAVVRDCSDGATKIVEIISDCSNYTSVGVDPHDSYSGQKNSARDDILGRYNTREQAQSAKYHVDMVWAQQSEKVATAFHAWNRAKTERVEVWGDALKAI